MGSLFCTGFHHIAQFFGSTKYDFSVLAQFEVIEVSSVVFAQVFLFHSSQLFKEFLKLSFSLTVNVVRRFVANHQANTCSFDISVRIREHERPISGLQDGKVLSKRMRPSSNLNERIGLTLFLVLESEDSE